MVAMRIGMYKMDLGTCPHTVYSVLSRSMEMYFCMRREESAITEKGRIRIEDAAYL